MVNNEIKNLILDFFKTDYILIKYKNFYKFTGFKVKGDKIILKYDFLKMNVLKQHIKYKLEKKFNLKIEFVKNNQESSKVKQSKELVNV